LRVAQTQQFHMLRRVRISPTLSSLSYNPAYPFTEKHTARNSRKQ
jgi:hypothetical protein